MNGTAGQHDLSRGGRANQVLEDQTTDKIKRRPLARRSRAQFLGSLHSEL